MIKTKISEMDNFKQVVKRAIEGGRKIIFYGFHKLVPDQRAILYLIIFQYDELTEDYTIISSTCINDEKLIRVISKNELYETFDEMMMKEIYRVYKILCDDYNKTAKEIMNEDGFSAAKILFFAEEFAKEVIDEYVYIEGYADDMYTNLSKESSSKEPNLIDQYEETIPSADAHDDKVNSKVNEIYKDIISKIYFGIHFGSLCCTRIELLSKNILDDPIHITVQISTELIQNQFCIGGSAFMRDSSNPNIAISIVRPEWGICTDDETIRGEVRELFFKAIDFMYKITSQKVRIIVNQYKFGDSIPEKYNPFDADLRTKKELTKGGLFDDV